MAMESLSSVEDSLDVLEEALAPLFQKSFSETVSELELLQQAKLQVLIPYVINDLVFIYLKTRGINPKTHPVIGELDRVKQYFDKIKQAEDPDKRRFAVDQGAATRFIKHAIMESKNQTQQSTHIRFTEDGMVTTASTKNSTPGPSAGVTIEQQGATEAALEKIAARKEDKNGSDSEEEDLAIITGDSTDLLQPRIDSGERRNEETTARKRRRGMDPWTGYIEPADESQGERAKSEKSAPSGSKQGTPMTQSDAGTGKSKKPKRAKKMQKARKAVVD